MKKTLTVNKEDELTLEKIKNLGKEDPLEFTKLIFLLRGVFLGRTLRRKEETRI